MIRNTEYDVIVAGGGPAGVCAGITAARNGMKTLIIEAATALGGMSTQGLVSTMAPLTDCEKIIYKSLPIEIMKRYKSKAGIDEKIWDWIPLSPEDLKLVYDEMVEEAGCDVLFQTTVSAAYTDNQRIKSIIVANKEGLTEYKAKVYIDCTGDADLANFSGVDFFVGEAGEVQSCSLCFTISNIKSECINIPIDSNPKDGIWAKIAADESYPLVTKHFIPTIIGDTLIVNGGHIDNLYSADVKAMSSAYSLGRKIATQYLEALKHYLPEVFGSAYLVSTAPLMGVRESRRIKGKYTLTIEDYLSRRRFDDEIALNCYWIDCHSAKNKSDTYYTTDPDWFYKPGECHGIPFRCLVPEGIDNLLVAGRSISVDRVVMESTRVMPNCYATGEAAGIAAMLSVKKGISVKNIVGSEVADFMK